MNLKITLRKNADMKKAKVLGILKTNCTMNAFSDSFKTVFSTSVKDLTSLVTSFALLFKTIR